MCKQNVAWTICHDFDLACLLHLRSSLGRVDNKRFGTCNLNFSKSRLHANVNEECECGMRETVRHFLLECPLFESARNELVANVRTIRTMRDKVITEDVLLGRSGVSLSPEHWEVIVSSVEKYVLSTKRKI